MMRKMITRLWNRIAEEQKPEQKPCFKTQEQGVDLAALELEYTLALQMPIIDKPNCTKLKSKKF